MMIEENSVIADALHALKMLHDEKVQHRETIEHLQLELAGLAIPPLPSDQEIRLLSHTERRAIVDIYAYRENLLRKISGSQKRAEDVDREIAHWEKLAR